MLEKIPKQVTLFILTIIYLLYISVLNGYHLLYQPLSFFFFSFCHSLLLYCLSLPNLSLAHSLLISQLFHCPFLSHKLSFSLLYMCTCTKVQPHANGKEIELLTIVNTLGVKWNFLLNILLKV